MLPQSDQFDFADQIEVTDMRTSESHWLKNSSGGHNKAEGQLVGLLQQLEKAGWVKAA